jgi:murein DD-endopeptidase MepM/ murein hydrolase activator NlpD
MRAVAVLAFVALASSTAFAEESLRRVGRLTVGVDESSSYPGGLLTVRIRSGLRYGVVHAILEGRRIPFLNSHRGLRAMVPVPVDAAAGPGHSRHRGALGSRAPALRGADHGRREELSRPHGAAAGGEEGDAHAARGVRDGRLVQLYLRTVSAKQEWQGPFRAPVAAAPEASFGCAQTYDAPAPIEAKTDAIWGEYHRGLDYRVPAGTPVSSPAAGNVLFAGPLVLTGQTVMLDHGQGVVSVFYHLASTRCAAETSSRRARPSASRATRG